MKPPAGGPRRSTDSRCLEAHLGNPTGGGVGREQWRRVGGVGERGDQQVRELLQVAPQAVGGIVVRLAGAGQAVFGVDQLRPEGAEVGVGLQVRPAVQAIGESVERAAEADLCAARQDDRPTFDRDPRRVAGADHCGERPALVRGVAGDDGDEVRDQVVPAAQFDVDLRPRVVHFGRASADAVEQHARARRARRQAAEQRDHARTAVSSKNASSRSGRQRSR